MARQQGRGKPRQQERGKPRQSRQTVRKPVAKMPTTPKVGPGGENPSGRAAHPIAGPARPTTGDFAQGTLADFKKKYQTGFGSRIPGFAKGGIIKAAPKATKRGTKR